MPSVLPVDITLEKILNLLKTKGIKDKDFVSAIGLYSSALSEWKSGKSVSYKKHIDKIADYLGVSSDYLLGRSDDPLPPVDMKDVTIVKDSYIGPLDPAEKEWLESVLAAYREKVKQDGKKD